MTLTLNQVRTMFDGAVAKASELGRAMAVSIVDDGGHVLLSGRMDGAPWGTVQINETMAESVTAFGMTGKKLARFNAEPWVGGVILNGGRPALGQAGAVAIKVDGKLVGAIACTGGSDEEDRVCAEAGIVAAGLTV
jgi:uncharacterized protein GlcG (DUF336 family)